ncbi:hypothetical protein PROFUN_12797 [Planoprotostelium fungivorum]|uniref:Uncharacterized protein n=1 Tax=Planoprotostelium fungivorum TaxID=1890364 RepID=A0A2P6N6P6_9EUKA|nr:hypothetical protein PROFUN_12797 [Planoprotostelium fungivorum]
MKTPRKLANYYNVTVPRIPIFAGDYDRPRNLPSIWTAGVTVSLKITANL